MRIVAAAVINNNGKYLITQRAGNDKLPLKWEFPGGKVELDETPEECLIREIKEELNLDIIVEGIISTSIYNYNSGTINLVAYAAQIVSGSINLFVHNDARWVCINQLDLFDFCPADIAIIEKLKELL